MSTKRSREYPVTLQSRPIAVRQGDQDGTDQDCAVNGVTLEKVLQQSSQFWIELMTQVSRDRKKKLNTGEDDFHLPVHGVDE